MEISQKIIDYAIWYYLRYYPSVFKLKLKLKEKFWPESENGKKYWWISEEQINYIIEERLKNIIQEDEVIKSKIRVFKERGKSKLYIRNKLFERFEPKELIELYLGEAFINWEEENLRIEYEKLEQKWLEKQKIFERLIRKWFRYDDVKSMINK